MKLIDLKKLGLPLLLWILISFINFLFVVKLDVEFALAIPQIFAGISSLSFDTRFWAVTASLMVWFFLFALTKPVDYWLAFVGLSSILILLLAVLGISFGPFGTSLLFGVFFVVALVLTKKKLPSFDWIPKNRSRWFLLPVLVPGLIYRAGQTFYEAAIHRGPAGGDELVFWWTSSFVLLTKGFIGYVRGFPVSGYTPGYPFLANFFLWPIPTGLSADFLFAVPAILGMLLFFFICDGKKRPWWLVAGIVSIWMGQFICHGWSYTMFFNLWYGEALAIACFAYLLRAIYQTENRGSIWDMLSLVGIGAMAIMSKPPLSLILIVAVLPTLFLAAFFQAEKKIIMKRTAIAGVGAALMFILWRFYLSRHQVGQYYSWEVGEMIQIHLTEGTFPRLMEYLFVLYRKFWVTFFLLTFLALSCDWRRYIGPLLAAYGMVFSVLLLYATKWSNFADHESGARYVLHGILGFTLYFLVDVKAEKIWPKWSKEAS